MQVWEAKRGVSIEKLNLSWVSTFFQATFQRNLDYFKELGDAKLVWERKVRGGGGEAYIKRWERESSEDAKHQRPESPRDGKGWRWISMERRKEHWGSSSYLYFFLGERSSLRKGKILKWHSAFSKRCCRWKEKAYWKVEEWSIYQAKIWL